MNTQPDNVEVTLDDLMALVEKAVGAIERLQADNAALTAQLREQESAATETAAELERNARQIAELEQRAAALQSDAHWCRWFRNKYGGENFSTFYAHIEWEYRAEHPDEEDSDARRLGPGSADLRPL